MTVGRIGCWRKIAITLIFASVVFLQQHNRRGRSFFPPRGVSMITG